MKKRQIKYIIGLVSFAMAGIILVQLLWINNTMSENEKRFSARVYAMLNRVVQKTERNEVALMYRLKPQNLRQYQGNSNRRNTQLDSIFKELNNQSMEQMREMTKASPFGKEINKLLDHFDSMQSMMDRRMQGKDQQLQSMHQWLSFEAEVKQLPLKKRLQLSGLEPILMAEKRNFNITIPMEYGVVKPDSNKPAIASGQFINDKTDATYKAEIFPNDVLGTSPKLIVQFPGKQRFLMHSIQWLLVLSLLFTLIILVAFYLTVRTIIQQKKLSEIKNDFINNMTHELKTPIATISLASDAMNRTINESASGFTKIIKQESERMHKHVEHILQMARIDKNEFKIQPELIEVNEFVQDVLENQKLRIEEKDGSSQLNLSDEKLQVEADRDHFANVLYNLIDNAIKYTTKAPEITINIWKRDSYAFISLADKGIGMSKDTQKRIFDKFYRASTGNVHNVKGFGLGLSYAKAVMERHNGDILAKSELNKGSVFTLKLPIAEENFDNK
ncbi:Alkaline phosphatase synthesis sensor protein PhoR [Salinivirga cyanobacteriivorans]|uniref:histidine kinase n=1 Tax=Salinivirga cyanobacteriivorans TaxID=1307839 RepID=A0A0S2HUT3_9BACT|nr:HAMP domain-containing sensor histidine kinase [Salinivirga cyanobacteriivorans]ALO13726.1 Alkaline phosphatase synthesis sensor protein PhoR [Salinivirga cyanobacteriivorans]